MFYFLFHVYKPKLIKAQYETMNLNGMNESQFIDTMQGMDEIKRKNKQSVFFQMTRGIYQQLHQVGYNLAILNTNFKIKIDILSSLTLIIVLSWCAYLMLNGHMTAGTLIAILQLTGMVTNATVSFSQILIGIEEAKIAFDRMFEFTAIEHESGPPKKEADEQILDIETLEVKDLLFRFPGKSALLKNFSFKVVKGESVAFIGENGCGKSTLMYILQKFFAIESGEILVNGTNLDQIGLNNWRSLIGVVSQETKIFNASLIDNILLGEEIQDAQQVEHFFSHFGFDVFFQQFPNGYATMLGESGLAISGGQKQIIGLARALVHQPRLLLLDEPTSALDNNTEAFMLQLLQKIKPNCIVVLFTHHSNIARKMDRIYVIEQGTIGVQGVHDELLLSENLYARSWYKLFE